MIRRALVALAGLSALAAALAGAAPALAGTYTVDTVTTSEIAGWQLVDDAGLFGCSFASRPGPCADADVGNPTPLRILAKGAVPAGALADWFWVAPPTTSFASGSVTLSYRTTADTRVYMKARLRSQAFAPQPQLHTVSDTGTVTWQIPAGQEAVGLFLTALAGHTYTDKWANSIRVASLSATVRDDTAPAGSLSGQLVDGAWHRESQDVCLSVSASDQGAGVASAVLADELGRTLASNSVPTQSARQPGLVDYSGLLCIAPSSLPDGEHPMSVIVTDAAGESTRLPFTLRVDSHAPVANGMTPAATTERRPLVGFSVEAGPSGLASFTASLDGQPMAIAGAVASLEPAGDLAFGLHTVTWSAVDHAGNSRDGFWTFLVLDVAPPTLSDAAPAPGWSGPDRRPAIDFTLTDTGTGIDPASLRVLLDGTDVAAAGSLSGGTFEFRPAADLAFGQHTVRVTVSDRSGNAMPPRQWTFSVVDATPPVLGDVRPDDGSAGSDRTPAISLVVSDDGGTGVDPARIVMTVDGADVTAAGSWSAGRFRYLPPAPLSFGTHVVTVRAADLADNAAEPLSWSFQVLDELPPVVAGSLPTPGITVPGAVTIGFDASDTGTGIDPASLVVMVDGSDVSSWGTLTGGLFRYAPGNLGAGVHTVAVTIADRSGNVAGPVMWQFAVADPATLSIRAGGGPTVLTAGRRSALEFVVRSNDAPLAGAEVRVSTRPAGQLAFGPARVLTSSPEGIVTWPIAPLRTAAYRVELATDGSVSATRTVVVRQAVTLRASTRVMRHGGALRLAGSVRPAHPGAAVRLQLLTGRGWVTVAAPRLGALSGFTRTVVPPVAGRYLFRAVVPATLTNAGGVSATVVVLVR